MDNKYVGSLPTTIFAQSGELDNYRIYGTPDGVGEETENLWDGEIEQGGLNPSGTESKSSIRVRSTKIAVQTNTTYTFAYVSSSSFLTRVILIAYDSQNNVVSNDTILSWTATPLTFSISQAAYIRFAFKNTNDTNISPTDISNKMLVEGSTAPASYIPYGYKIPILNTSGVTENLFDYTAQDTNNGFKANKYLNGAGGVNDSSNHNISEYIEIEPNTVYSLCQQRPQLAVSMCFYNSEKSFISSTVEGSAITTVTSPASAKYVRFTILISYQAEIMFVSGSTAPDHYIPHRYESNYDLFLGDSKLYADEYMDFVEQKVYKRTENLFTEEDSGLIQITATGIKRYGKDVGVLSAGTYTIDYTLLSPDSLTLWLHTVKNGVYTSEQIESHPYTFTLNEDKDVIFRTSSQQSDTTWQTLGVKDIMLVFGSTAPESYIPYLQPTDPPIPLSAILTYKDENTISSTEAITKAQFNWTIMEVDSLKMPDNTYYDFKDTQGRAQLSEIQSWINSQESSISTTKVGLQVDYQNKTNTRLGIPTLDPNTGLPFTFDSLSIYSNRRRCNVNDAGEITAWYGDEDYKEDGSNGQVMVYQPKFYYRVEPVRLEEQSDGLGYHIRCANYWISETPITGFRVHPAFINEDGNEVDYYLTGAYEASIYDTSESTYLTNDEQVASFANDLLCSIANVKPASGLTQNLTRANCELMAKNRGNVGWHNTTIQIESAEQLLMMIELGTMNFQNAIGAGVTNISDNSSYNCSALTGSTSILGNVSGRATSSIVTKGDSSTTYTANGYVSISYRGRENPYGNIWKFVEGMIIAGRGESKGGIPFICNDFAFPETSSTTAGTGTHDFTLNGYTSASFTITNADGYISAMGYGNELYDWLFVASKCSGNSTAPVGDYTYKTANLDGTRVARLGGAWDAGASAGSFFWALNGALTGRVRYLGGRAALIPRKLTHSILT